MRPLAADIEIRPTTPDDIAALASNLRDLDWQEMQAYGRKEPLAPLMSSFRQSLMCWSGLAGGELACVIGVSPISMLGGIGSPWMMGTPVLDRNSRVLMRMAPAYIGQMLAVFPHLINFVHAKNHTSVRWLKRLGFQLSEPEPFGALREPFHRFEMRA